MHKKKQKRIKQVEREQGPAAENDVSPTIVWAGKRFLDVSESIVNGTNNSRKVCDETYQD